MFTGIIEDVLEVRSIEKSNDFCTLNLVSPKIIDAIKIGDSIAVNGVCLTIVDVFKDSFSVNIVKETLNKTNLGNLEERSFVNIERAMKASSRFDGHFVQGHIEDVVTIVSMEEKNNQLDLIVKINKKFLKYCLIKGSITLDGISLTIADIDDCNIKVAIIPHTYDNTVLKFKENNDKLNLETDIFVKYVEKLLPKFEERLSNAK